MRGAGNESVGGWVWDFPRKGVRAAYQQLLSVDRPARRGGRLQTPSVEDPPKTKRQKRDERATAVLMRAATPPPRAHHSESNDLGNLRLDGGRDIAAGPPSRPLLSSVGVHGAPPLVKGGAARPSDGAIELQQAMTLGSGAMFREDNNEGDQENRSPGGESMKHRGGECLGVLRVFASQPVLTALLLFIPLGYTSHFLKWGAPYVFVLNFLSIVPQAWLMGKATEDLAAHMGQVTGGLLNAWFGNVVEMLLCIAGLRAGELVIVKATLVGSILSNLLLVAGCSFLFGGIKHTVQEFSAIGASTNASLMTLSCLCLGLPTIYATLNPSGVAAELNISRSVSFMLVIIYAQYLVFQLGTHAFLFEDDEEEEEEADMSRTSAAILLASCTACCSFNSEFLIQSIEGTVNCLKISKSFIGIILLPIIGNAAEHYTSVVVAMKNKMDLSLACAVVLLPLSGSSCQMSLFVTPFVVLVGWLMGQPMSLDLHAFEMAVLFLSVLVVTSILQDGYSNWLEGSMLVSAYLVIGLIYFFEDPKG